MDRFDTDYQPSGRRDYSKKTLLTRVLVVVVVFAVIVIGWNLIHPLAPGSVSISISGPTKFRAGAPEKLKVTMKSEHGYPAWDSVDWGDGVKESNPDRHPTFHGDPCGQYFVPTNGGTPPPIPHVDVGTLPPAQAYVEFLHRYRRPGNYLVTVYADEFGRVCTNQRSPSGSGQINLHVEGPVAPGNGSSEPRPGIALKLYDYYHRLTGYLGAEDSDGYLRSITVTWIDGTTHVVSNDIPCSNKGNVWPSGLMGFRWRQHIWPGSYTIKIAALSTDCSGHESQMITMVAKFRLVAQAKDIRMSEVVFIPHKPNGNADANLPAWEIERFGGQLPF